MHVLSRLIHEDIKQGEQAGMPFFAAAGLKLLEARVQLQRGHFEEWIERHFKFSPRTARVFMELARTQNGSTLPKWQSIREFKKETRKLKPTPAGDAATKREEYLQQLHRDAEQQRQKREAQRELGFRLIKIGYRELAKELHPDGGGSTEQMALLNVTRKHLENMA